MCGVVCFFFLQAEDGIRDLVRSRGLGDVYKRQGLEWTVVRVPRLTDTPQTGKVRVGMVGQGTGANLSRADMAEFMLQQVDDGRYLRQAPVISN